jgi:hypothetical protein
MAERVPPAGETAEMAVSWRNGKGSDRAIVRQLFEIRRPARTWRVASSRADNRVARVLEPLHAQVALY